MLSSVEQAFVGREEIRAPLKTPAWEARVLFYLGKNSGKVSLVISAPKFLSKLNFLERKFKKAKCAGI